jgi:ankyrin repeat protein
MNIEQKLQRMRRPEELKKSEPLVWSSGIGTDVWEMFCACMRGDLKDVQQLIAKDPSLVRCHHEYRTPLSFAVRENQIEVAAWLFDHGADPFGVVSDVIQTAQDRDYIEMEQMLRDRFAARYNASSRGEAVAAAIRERNPAQVKKLLDDDPDLLHAGDRRSNQPIHWAVMTRQLDFIDELIARGANLDAPRGDGARPLQLVNGDYHYRGWRDVPAEVATTPKEVYDHLVACGAYVDIGMASATGNLDRVRELLARDATLANRVDAYNSYYIGCGAPLKNAAAGGHLEIVKLLLEHGANPNLPEEGIAPQGHALYSAVANGHFEIAKLLLEHGAIPNPAVESSADALSRATSNGDQPMIDLLCSYGASRSVELLAYYNDLRTAAAVFAANPALADDPSALSCATDKEPFLRLMLRYQPDLPKRSTLGGDTPGITELFFDHGMDANQPDWMGITQLHRFAESGNLQNAEIFLAHGADVNAVDAEFCSTPLGWAARSGKAEVVKWLLENGADPNLPADPAWARPQAWATRRGHSEIVKILMDK